MAVSVVRFVLLLAATAVPAAAQETVWSSVAFVLNGERTPLQGSNTPELTPLGAQQMYELGSMFRARYLSGYDTNNSMANITTSAPIEGIEEDSLDNSQVNTRSTDDSYVAASALAFLQGLYPPQTSSFALGNGGREAAVLSNNTLISFPLNGYQYPLVATVSHQDPASTWIEANVGCTEYQQSVLSYRNEDSSKAMYNETLEFYQSLWTGVFQGVFSQATTNYYYAYNLYDYASYEYKHNPQMGNALDYGDLAILRMFAYTQQLNLNGDLSVSGLQEGDMIRAISGRMLATYVVNLLKSSMASFGSTNKLNLLFGSFEPFLAYFMISGLLDGESVSVFQDLPGPGAVMVWEMYTESDNTTEYPSIDDLYVRFLYRPSTDSDAPLTQYGIFTEDSSASTSGILFQDFANAMYAIGVPSVTKWCTMCAGISVFCAAFEGDSSGSSSGSSGSGISSSSSAKNSVSPAVAGIIGAIVTISVISLIGLTAVLLGGLRVYRASSSSYNANSNGDSNGDGSDGFKGAERKPGDADVAVSKSGVRHERMGSWELNGGKKATHGDSPLNQPESLGSVLQKSRVRSTIKNTNNDDDDMADLIGPAVTPREHV